MRSKPFEHTITQEPYRLEAGHITQPKLLVYNTIRLVTLLLGVPHWGFGVLQMGLSLPAQDESGDIEHSHDGLGVRYLPVFDHIEHRRERAGGDLDEFVGFEVLVGD